MTKLQLYTQHSIWFKPKIISSSYFVIAQARVVLKRTVVGELRRSSSESSEQGLSVDGIISLVR